MGSRCSAGRTNGESWVTLSTQPIFAGGSVIGIEELVAQARTAFGWTPDIGVSAGPRGALGQIWRLEIGSARYALKHIFDEAPTEASIRVELDLIGRAREVGVRAPASHAARDGRYLQTARDGTWFRCYDWLDLRPVVSDASDTAHRLGALLAGLHQCAPAASAEPNGDGPPDPWYDQVPLPRDWEPVLTSGAPWAARLNDRLTMLPQACAAVRAVDPARLILCHRDLHFENVFVDPEGELVVVDWDDLGPADPGRELARALFDWWCSDVDTDLEAVRAMVESYLDAGGPGRISGPADFSMLLACRLNFLVAQAAIALDPHAETAHREWAEHEIDVGLRLLPTPRQLADVLAVASDYRESGALTHQHGRFARRIRRGS